MKWIFVCAVYAVLILAIISAFHSLRESQREATKRRHPSARPDRPEDDPDFMDTL